MLRIGQQLPSCQDSNYYEQAPGSGILHWNLLAENSNSQDSLQARRHRLGLGGLRVSCTLGDGQFTYLLKWDILKTDLIQKCEQIAQNRPYALRIIMITFRPLRLSGLQR